jgi:hypothetical protein
MTTMHPIHFLNGTLRGISGMISAILFAAGLGMGSLQAADQENPSKAGPTLKALLITGGCCHNYPLQSKALMEAAGAQAQVEWTVIDEGGNGTRAMIDLYDKPRWADGYDVIVHNECFADTTDEDYIRRITKAHHEGVPAVVIHCAMHTYRSAKIDDWREFLGVTSRRHDHQSRYAVKPVLKSHPIMKTFPEAWTTPMDELYVIEKLWPNAKALATSVSERDGKEYPGRWHSPHSRLP